MTAISARIGSALAASSTPVSQAWTRQRLRTFLLGLAAALLLVAIADLVLAQHTGSKLQLVPFGLCALGLGSLLAYWRRPSRRTALLLRTVMAIAALGSLVGVYLHFTGNVRPALAHDADASVPHLVRKGLRGDAPLLAPGIFAAAAAVAIAASFAEGLPPASRPSPDDL